MQTFSAANKKYHWRVKDTVTSPWRDLPGTYTVEDMLKMRIERIFSAAIVSDAAPQKEVASDD